LVVTCRINAYGDGQDLEGLKDFTLAPLNRKQIDGFIERWYKARVALKRETPEAAEVGIIDLKKAVRGEGISDMAENPMLLTTLTLLYQGKTRLPDQRVAVYDRAIKILIEDWQQAKGHIPAPLRDLLSGEILLREILEELAYQAHQNKNKDGEYDLSRMLALAVLKEKLDSEELAGHFLDYVDQKAGIFIGKGGVSNQVVAYGFAHRTFQEYLAGCRLTADNRSYYRDLVENYLSNPDEWALAIQLGLEELYYNRKNSLFLRDQAYQLFRGDVPETLESRRGVLIAAEIARLVNPENIRKDQHCPKKWMEHLATTLTTLLRLPDFPARDRCQAGVKLGHLGDTRPAVLVVDQMEVALIPPGPFWMGSPDSDDMRSQDEKLHRNEALNYPYWLSRFPVSNAQFQTFVEDQGYADQRWWAEAQEAGYWNPKGIKVYGDETERMAPVDFGHPFSLPNHPVVGISWYEMLAFCRWLTTRWQSKGWLRGNWEVFLPSEAEWEKGSRGGLQLPEEPIIRGIDQGITFQRLDLPKDNPQPQRRYPWGEEPDPKHMNTFETRIKGTSALGAFPGGASPYGLEEISGNVWEWTRSLWSDLPYDPKDGREKLNLDKGRVVRGGAFHLNQRGACGSCRGDVNPDGRFSGGGFRIVLVPIERTAER
ncbi:MAG TPA: SUMF1/EgtB/PvdO family nonheme iron enzyme, partial [Calditrichia bacterium]|nr:SUMF1/EgtB/PvdO family nonheme iron enzyme [Calditrichia bacterium]